MTILIYRASELYNHPPIKARPASAGRPARNAKPAKRGIFGVGKSHFYEVIEPQLEKVRLGPKAVGYTGRSVTKIIEQGVERRVEHAAVNPATA
jgi:hypothetical protein